MRLIVRLLNAMVSRMRSFVGRMAPLQASDSIVAAENAGDAEQFATARALHQQGKLKEAEFVYQSLLQKHPKHFDLLHLLSTIRGQCSDFPSALAYVEQALAVEPESAVAHRTRGNCLKGLGNLEDALASYDRALALQPGDADTLHNRGATLSDMKLPEQALDNYDRALLLDPHHVSALDNRGMALWSLHRTGEALISFERAIAVRAGYAPGYLHRGMALIALERFEEAKASLEIALELSPDNPDALRFLGTALSSLGLFEEALSCHDRALKITPRNPDLLFNKALALQKLDHHEQALLCLDQTIAILPTYNHAQFARGVTLNQLGRYNEALEAFDNFIAVEPNNAAAHYNRSAAAGALGRFNEALANCERAVALDPGNPDMHCHQGAILYNLKRHEDALSSFDLALKYSPNHAEALLSRGATLRELKRYQEALESLDKLLALSPDHARAHYSRGIVLMDLERRDEALSSFQHTLNLDSTFTEALLQQSSALSAMGRTEEALVVVRKALELNQGSAMAHDLCGDILAGSRQYEAALACYDAAIAIDPSSADRHYKRGTALLRARRESEALDSFGKALALNANHLPSLFTRGHLLVSLRQADAAVDHLSRLMTLDASFDFAKGHLLNAKMLSFDWSNLDGLLSGIDENVRLGNKSILPFHYLTVSHSLPLLKRCAEIYGSDKFPPKHDGVHSSSFSSISRGGKIRVGYVAGEFLHHATSFLTIELFERHDASQFEIIAFDNGWDDGSEIRKRLQSAFAMIVDISRLSDFEAASRIRDMKIDILVDLNGHVGRARTGIFSYRPAPVQVNWLGFPGTMGVDYMDYIIGDAVVIPPEHEPCYSEKVVRLPDTYQPNDSKRIISGRIPTRREVSLPASGFVFCCFNNNFKITPEIFGIWMRLLQNVDGSVLWLLDDAAAGTHKLRHEAAARGIAPERLVFAPRANLPDHLARHQLADLFLDTLPYNAHTTASDALWAGLPLLTCLGSTFAGRVAGSLLHAVGLPDLVTNNLADYESLASKLATTPSLLEELRIRLDRNRSTHPLFDADRFRRHIEAAYIIMVEHARRGERPAAFDIKSLYASRIE